MVRAHGLGGCLLARGACDHRHLRTHGLGLLDCHRAQASEAAHADTHTRPGAEANEGRVGGDASAQERAELVERVVLGRWHDEALMHDHLRRVAAEGVGCFPSSPVFGRVVVRKSFALGAHVLVPGFAVLAVEAAVHEASDAHVVAQRHSGHLCANGGDNTSHLVAGYTWILGYEEVILGEVNVRVTNTAELDVNDDVRRARGVTLRADGLEAAT
mmetsp:Transcript_5155/g.12838  ORF Transcript_5155/g.12838 Transcript_5155/m.12838 type:complete len:215 (+) Transcript_5155:329-973(+)